MAALATARSFGPSVPRLVCHWTRDSASGALICVWEEEPPSRRLLFQGALEKITGLDRRGRLVSRPSLGSSRPRSIEGPVSTDLPRGMVRAVPEFGETIDRVVPEGRGHGAVNVASGLEFSPRCSNPSSFPPVWLRSLKSATRRNC